MVSNQGTDHTKEWTPGEEKCQELNITWQMQVPLREPGYRKVTRLCLSWPQHCFSIIYSYHNSYSYYNNISLPVMIICYNIDVIMNVCNNLYSEGCLSFCLYNVLSPYGDFRFVYGEALGHSRSYRGILTKTFLNF